MVEEDEKRAKISERRGEMCQLKFVGPAVATGKLQE